MSSMASATWCTHAVLPCTDTLPVFVGLTMWICKLLMRPIPARATDRIPADAEVDMAPDVESLEAPQPTEPPLPLSGQRLVQISTDGSLILLLDGDGTLWLYSVASQFNLRQFAPTSNCTSLKGVPSSDAAAGATRE